MARYIHLRLLIFQARAIRLPAVRLTISVLALLRFFAVPLLLAGAVLLILAGMPPEPAQMDYVRHG